VHINLLNRDSQLSRLHVHSDASKTGEIAEMWCLRNYVKEVFGGIDLAAGCDS
tara:strand:- start:5117 stop:5275 length:159 start_codon:yes stop_codon:yes gene_type:complete